MNRPSFRTRALKRISQDTCASAKGRITPFLIGIVGVILGFLFNAYYLHLHAAGPLAVLALVCLVGSYAIWFLSAWVVNTFRVPWLLDAESGRLINEWEKKAQNAEAAVAELKNKREENRRLHDRFASLMQSGIVLSSDLASCTVNGLSAWDARFDKWLISVKDAISDEGFASEAIAFIRAGEDAEPVTGVVDFRSEREERCRVLEQHQKKLEDIVRRRLP